MVLRVLPRSFQPSQIVLGNLNQRREGLLSQAEQFHQVNDSDSGGDDDSDNGGDDDDDDDDDDHIDDEDND